MHNKPGRFCREKQYADELELLLKQKQIPYKREFELKEKDLEVEGNKVDFLIDNKIILEIKA